ncbi:MAG: hypothetical protein L6V85_09755 [Clostridiales bacterium]|nr:MAG: hypothetical protein L6V85_09755 [Clostridiales bacterium]
MIISATAANGTLWTCIVPRVRKTKKLPVIIDIHGGGWMYGDKDLNAPYCEALAKRGFVVVSFFRTVCFRA